MRARERVRVDAGRRTDVGRGILVLFTLSAEWGGRTAVFRSVASPEGASCDAMSLSTFFVLLLIKCSLPYTFREKTLSHGARL